jgi:hypothetical protein
MLDFCNYLAAKTAIVLAPCICNILFVAQIKVPQGGIICVTISFYKYTKKWSFCNVYLSMSQQKQFSPMQIHKRTATNKTNLHNCLLSGCVSVYELKNHSLISLSASKSVMVIRLRTTSSSVVWVSLGQSIKNYSMPTILLAHALGCAEKIR